MEDNSPEFRWLNKFAGNFNFTFGVDTEHWHVDWIPFLQNVKVIKGPRIRKPVTWTTAGQNDTHVTLVGENLPDPNAA